MTSEAAGSVRLRVPESLRPTKHARTGFSRNFRGGRSV